MKKLLTVLLVIAVMFTFSFGSAFAFEAGDAPDNISDGYFETLWANYVKVTSAETIAIDTYDVEKTIIAGFKAEAKAAYDEYMADATAYVTEDTAFAGILAGTGKKAEAFRLTVAKAQFDADKADALAKLGTVPTFNYSTKVMSNADATIAENATKENGVAQVKFVGKDYTYQKAAEKLVEYFKGLVEDADDFNADVNVALYKAASTTVAGVIADALYPICFADDAATVVESLNMYDLKVAYDGVTLPTGTVDGVADTTYVKSGTNNNWSVQKVDAGEKIEDANIAAAKARNSAVYAAYLIENPKNTEYADKWLKVANIIVEDNFEATVAAPNGTVYAKQADAIAELEEYAAKWGAEKDANGQPVRDAEKVKKALEDGTVAIAKAENDDVADVLAAAKTNVANAKTKAVADELAFVKDSAKKAIELKVSDAVEDETYYEAELNDVKAIAEKYTAKVEAAEDKAAVAEAYEEFLTKVAAVDTATALDTAWTRQMTTENKAAKVLYDAAIGYANYYNTGLDDGVNDSAAFDTTTLKTRLAEMIGKSGVRTEKEIKALKDEAVKLAQALPTNDAVKAAKKALKAAVEALPTKATVADLAAVQAVSDAIAAYNDLTTVAHGVALTSYESAVSAIVTGYNAQFAQQFAKISDTDEAAIKALIADIDATIDTLRDLESPAAPATTYLADMKAKLEGDNFLGKIKKTELDAVKAAINAIPVNVTEADKATVVKARELYDAYVAKYNDYEALYNTTGTLTENDYVKGYVANDIDIKELVAAETVLGLNAVSPAELVKGLKLTAKSTAKKGSITVKWTVKGEADIDGYEIWKSTKANKGYKKAFTTTKKTYKNSKGLKKGTRYYYKVRAYKVIDGVKVTSDWSNKANRKAK